MSWITIEHQGKLHRIVVAGTRDGVWVGWSGRSAYFARDRKTRAAGGVSLATAADEIRSPMTGRVVAIKVAPGVAVEEGTILIVLEAMKMEYRLTAPSAGRVDAVHCREGELVDLGKTLVSLSPSGSP